MNRSPEEYGAYWRASLLVTAGAFLAVGGYHFVGPLFRDPGLGTTLFGWLLFGLFLTVGCYFAVLGLARVIERATGR